MRMSIVTKAIVCMLIIVVVGAAATLTTRAANDSTTRITGGSASVFDDIITIRFVLIIPTLMYVFEEYAVNFTVDIDFHDVASNVTVFYVQLEMLSYSSQALGLSERVEYDLVQENNTDHVLREGTAMITPFSPAPDSRFMCIVEFSAYNNQSVYSVMGGPDSVDGVPVYSTVLQPFPWLVMTAVLTVAMVLSLYSDSMISHASKAPGPGE